MAENSDEMVSPTRVQFSEDVPAGAIVEPSKRKLELTQRYDREEVQKRLDIESWMDEQMKVLFDCKVRHNDCFVHVDNSTSSNVPSRALVFVISATIII